MFWTQAQHHKRTTRNRSSCAYLASTLCVGFSFRNCLHVQKTKSSWLHHYVTTERLSCIFIFQIFSPIMRLMLTHQSSADAAACLFAIILLVQPLNWIPGVYVLDTIICHLWNGQFIYWYSIFISGEAFFIILFPIYMGKKTDEQTMQNGNFSQLAANMWLRIDNTLQFSKRIDRGDSRGLFSWELLCINSLTEFTFRESQKEPPA